MAAHALPQPSKHLMLASLVELAQKYLDLAERSEYDGRNEALRGLPDNVPATTGRDSDGDLPVPVQKASALPGSTTTRGRHVSCGIDTRRVAFCGTENISTPNLSYAAQYLACALPCERFTSAFAGIPCITRGRCGSLLLHRDGLPPSTFCRSPGAPVHSIRCGHAAA